MLTPKTYRGGMIFGYDQVSWGSTEKHMFEDDFMTTLEGRCLCHSGHAAVS